jgi:sugar-specific transcriptional regulator TrmB
MSSYFGQLVDTTARLTQLGLSAAEAQIYVALLRNGPLTVREVAEVTGSGRTSVYPILYSLEERGLVDGGASYGTRFAAIAPEQSLPNLIARRREALFSDERLSESLVRELSKLVPAATTVEDEAVQVLRSPRLIAERFARLQNEAVSSIDVFIKAPFFAPAGNPAEQDVLARGVRCRGLYEEAVLESEHVAPHLQHWSDLGEEIRLYPGVS